MRFITAVAAALPAPSAALADCDAYCMRWRIQLDPRSPDEMRRNLGACPMSQGFSTRASAESFARPNFGGIGGSCSCR